ncbi:Transmembrane protease serine 9 [Aphelenchoides bicaudatus]|nr:Transmembrane protease serine 9 [Aphelenchoides bicaudatus]
MFIWRVLGLLWPLRVCIFFIVLTCLESVQSTEVEWPHFSLQNSTVYVKWQTGPLPLCAESFRVQIGDEICRQARKDGPLRFNSVKRIPLNTPIGIQVECSLNQTKCQTSLAVGCTDGVQVECLELKQTLLTTGCPSGWFQFGEAKCVGVLKDSKVSNYEDALQECQRIGSNFHLASFSSQRQQLHTEYLQKQIEELAADLKQRFEKPQLLLTSALRIGGHWQWANKVLLIDSPEGKKGRCAALNLVTKKLEAVDCSDGDFLPLCLPCLRWNDRLVTQNGYFAPAQRFWTHNYCRNPAGTPNIQPWCMVSASTFQECRIPQCEFDVDKNEKLEEELRFRNGQPEKTEFKCSKGEKRCGVIEQCVEEDFFCDYEMDCRNGFDETGCPDFLRHFDTIGGYKLVNEVSLIWTHIPHVQGCAQRCIETKDFRCESFSYEQNKEICLLSKVADNPAVLFEHLDSIYYRRKFGEDTPLKTEKDVATMVIYAQKNDQKAPICVDGMSDDGSLHRLCSHFGYGLPMLSVWKSPTLTTKWTVECLRDSNCTKPSNEEISCNKYLQCSDCSSSEFACQLTHECVPASSICNGKVECADATDEIGCENLEWRLWDGADGEIQPEGRVQIRFQHTWTDVCADGMHSEQIDRLCSRLGHGKTGRLLPISDQVPTAITWQVHCAAHECRPIRNQRPCMRGILNVRCEKEEECKFKISLNSINVVLVFCGRRFAQIKKRKRRREPRVVGGFSTIPRSFPWSAALKFHDGNSHHCGSVIISEKFLLSAAHCFEKTKNESEFYIVTGDWDNTVDEGTEQKFNLTRIHFYPKYEDLFQHDIVILELEANKTITFNEANQPICLVPRGYRYKSGQVCLASGWGSNGTTYPQRLQAAAMPILETAVCRNASKVYSAVSQTAFCAGYLSGGVDSCQGDSGGAFSCEHDDIHYLAGIISWGDGCAQINNPGIYTMITPYLSWIQNITGIET